MPDADATETETETETETNGQHAETGHAIRSRIRGASMTPH
jgi:hypothetical protein